MLWGIVVLASCGLEVLDVDRISADYLTLVVYAMLYYYVALAEAFYFTMN